MVIAAEPSLAADWAAVSIAAALETSITATTVVASNAIPIAVAINDDHPLNRHGVNDCLHDGPNKVIVNDGLTLSCSMAVVCPVDSSDRRQCPSPELVTMMTDDRVTYASLEQSELKWITGGYYWIESVQSYNKGGWDYIILSFASLSHPITNTLARTQTIEKNDNHKNKDVVSEGDCDLRGLMVHRRIVD